ncbi:MAG: geranylgeranyl reductase family protein [Actinobacteria bacterium]|nr:geranylgeranyl reductase family protein [Actinomycetota bacterium]
MCARERFDLVVVGAGPAGSATAISARDRGLDVLVIDKATFPRDKTCGDGLTTGALRSLEHLGLELDALPSYATVRETVLVSPSGRTISLPHPPTGQYAGVVPRADLDAALVELARRRGATVREGTGVDEVSVGPDHATVTLSDGRAAEAPFVVAADGHFSAVRRLLHPDAPADLGSWHAFRQYFRGVDDPRLWVLFEEDLLPGYAWVFPLPGGRANVGFGIPRGPGVDGKTLKATWLDLLERDRLRTVLGPDAQPEDPQRAWPIPAQLEPARLTDGRVLFAGDAASVVDPMTGEGIAQAFETAIAAGAAVAGGGDAPAVGARYRRAVERTLGADLRLAARLQRVLGSAFWARAALRTVDLTPWTRRNFARWMYEDYPRALLLTPRRWRRGMFTGPGAYRTA